MGNRLVTWAALCVLVGSADLAQSPAATPKLEFDARLNDGADGSAPPDTAGPAVDEALRKQLGLKLESQKRPVDQWIADHVERPTEN